MLDPDSEPDPDPLVRVLYLAPDPERVLFFSGFQDANKKFSVFKVSFLITIVVDPDPYVSGPPGSAYGSVSHKYGS